MCEVLGWIVNGGYRCIVEIEIVIHKASPHPLLSLSLLPPSPPPPPECHTYQLRAYLYQARDMYASDKTGLSDPYAIMSFGRYSTKSRVVKESLCPTWDQTMVINQIRVFGDTQSILASPPPVVLEFYDKDQVVCYDVCTV